jgi:hypothetical protein
MPDFCHTVTRPEHCSVNKVLLAVTAIVLSGDKLKALPKHLRFKTRVLQKNKIAKKHYRSTSGLKQKCYKTTKSPKSIIKALAL